ncbi:1683_t:CDS:2, partial [Gigaspora rosea]
MAREPHFASIIMGDETPHKYSVKLIEFLHANNVRKFDYSQFSQLRYIQKGQSAMVYSATFENKVYALKCLNNNLLMDQETLKHLTREVTNLYNINHPNVIKLYGVSINISNFLLVLQFADKTLREYLKSKRIENLYQISWDELINLAKGITNGINYLHEKKIIHRDLVRLNVFNIVHKIIINNERPETVPDTPSGYIDLIKKCWSSNQKDRPTTGFILNQLEKLSTESINTITNRIVIR